MSVARRTGRSARSLRDVAVALAGFATASLHAVTHTWAAFALAIVFASGWIVARRLDRSRMTDMAVQTAFIAIGMLTVIRLQFSLLPIAVAATWLLVCAIDLDRFVILFPADSPAAVQSAALRRRLTLLGIVGVASAGIVAVASIIRVEITLLSAMLLALLLVIALVRTIRELATEQRNERE